MLEIILCSRCKEITIKNIMVMLKFSSVESAKKLSKADNLGVTYLCSDCGKIVENSEDEQTHLAKQMTDLTGRNILKIRIGAR